MPSTRSTWSPNETHVTPDYVIQRLQEINRTLLPDFPGKTPNADSVGLARSQVVALIGDVAASTGWTSASRKQSCVPWPPEPTTIRKAGF